VPERIWLRPSARSKTFASCHAAGGGELADRVGITTANLAVLKNGRAKAVRFTTLAALCEVLKCQPGDLLRWEAEDTAGE
jgi:putative transcriptional regulator